MPQVKGGVPTWKSEYIEGRQRSRLRFQVKLDTETYTLRCHR